MKLSTFVTAIALAFASTSSAQTACDSVASAIPTCGVRLPSSLIMLALTLLIFPSNRASYPQAQLSAAAPATTAASAPALLHFKTPRLAASLALAESLQPCRFRLQLALSVPALLLLRRTKW